MTNFMKQFVRDDEGATMVEYGIMVALIAVFCIAAVRLVGTNVDAVFDAVAAAMAGVI